MAEVAFWPRRVEVPVRVFVQLLPALVEAIERRKEGDRVSDVNQDRHVELRGRRPERIEPGIVDRDELPLGLAEAQPEPLPDLQASRTEGNRLAQALRLRLAKIGVGGEMLVVDPGEDGEAVRIGLLIAGKLGA